jgi:hypothetical protein
LRVWEVATGKEVRRLDLPGVVPDPEGMALCPDGQHFLTGSDADQIVSVRSLLTGTERYRFILSRKPRGLSISRNGRLAVVGSFRGAV